MTTIEQSEKVEVVTESVLGKEAKMVANLSIDGMMCTMACGGKITKELLKLEGTKDVDIDFQEDRTINHAIVEFDPNRLSADELIACIHRIADGKLYAVRKVTITEYSIEG